jgi:hypothetical protein
MIFFTCKQEEWCALFYPLGQISYVANSGLYVKLTFPPYITATTGDFNKMCDQRKQCKSKKDRWYTGPKKDSKERKGQTTILKDLWE